MSYNKKLPILRFFNVFNFLYYTIYLDISFPLVKFSQSRKGITNSYSSDFYILTS